MSHQKPHRRQGRTRTGAVTTPAFGGGIEDLGLYGSAFQNGQVPVWNSARQRFEPGTAGGGNGFLRQAVIDIDHAGILTLTTAPPELVAAPGVGKIAFPLFALLREVGTVAYTNANIDGAQFFICHPITSPLMTVLVNDSALFLSDIQIFFGDDSAFSSATKFVTMIPATGPEGATYASVLAKLVNDPGAMENQPILLFLNNAGDLTGGDAANTLTVSLVYVIYNISTGLFE